MRIEYLPTGMLLVSILSIALGGCSDSGKGGEGGATTTRNVTGNGGATTTRNVTGNGGTTDGEDESQQTTSTRGGAQASSRSKGGGGTQDPQSTRDSSAALGSSGNIGGKSGDSAANLGGKTSGSGGSAVSAGTGTRGPVGGGGAKSSTGVTSGGTTGATTSSKASTNTGTCTPSKSANKNVSGSGPHKVTVETNADPGIKEGTIYRPTDLDGDEKFPIFVWGEGGCSQDGFSNSAAMGEIASHGYFVIADGTPGSSTSRSMDSSNPTAMGKPMIAYLDWAITENDKPCSAYYHHLDTTKIATNGFSCGGLMAEGTAGDPRLTTWGITSSGLFAANQALYKTVHTPVLIILGGASDMAYENGSRDYENLSALEFPIMLFSKDLGHGGDLFKPNGGDFTKISLAWLNWWLKGDEGATGRGLLVGSGCTYCKDSAWEVKSKNIP